MGKLVVIEGLDGSGKATQAALLEDTLRAAGKPVRKLSFPNYESDSSALVRMYLGGDFGTNPGDVNAYAASAFYAVDRYAGWKMDWGGFYKEGGLLVADRYATSNAIHQCAKLPKEQWGDYVAWLEDFEYAKLGLPKPDLVVYLDVPTKVSQQLLARRYGGADKRDIHERDEAYLALCREAAAWCAETLGWRAVHSTQKGEMRLPEDIAAEVLALVKGL